MLKSGATKRRGTIHRANMPARAWMGAPGRWRRAWTRPNQTRMKQDHAAVDRHDAGEQEVGVARIALARVAEEPRPGQLGLEGRTCQGGADADGHDGEEAQKCGLTQEAPVIRGPVVGLDTFGEGEAGG